MDEEQEDNHVRDDSSSIIGFILTNTCVHNRLFNLIDLSKTRNVGVQGFNKVLIQIWTQWTEEPGAKT